MNKALLLCFGIFLIGWNILDTFAITSAYQREKILSTHNSERKRLWLPWLTWDDTITKDAEQWAKTIAQTWVMEHASPTERKNMGENIYFFSTTARVLKSDGSDASRMWIDEKPYYSYTSNSCTSRECRHYTQIIWRNTTRIGCGRATKKAPSWTSVYWVCRYDPPGNYIGQKPY